MKHFIVKFNKYWNSIIVEKPKKWKKAPLLNWKMEKKISPSNFYIYLSNVILVIGSDLSLSCICASK